MSHKNNEHGTIKSYITGFVLSLIFTIIPYYLVTHKSVSGKALLATILSFGVLQMAIQIFFFLHLGRGPKPLYNIFFFVGTVGLILVVVIGSIFIIDNLHYNMSGSEVTQKLSQDESIAQVGGKDTGACQAINANHKVFFSNGKVSPAHTDAGLCDSLTFINQDSAAHKIVFGVYPKTQTYGGETEESVRKNYPKTITLNQIGSFSFYDQNNQSIKGTFTVTP